MIGKKDVLLFADEHDCIGRKSKIIYTNTNYYLWYINLARLLDTKQDAKINFYMLAAINRKWNFNKDTFTVA